MPEHKGYKATNITAKDVTGPYNGKVLGKVETGGDEYAKAQKAEMNKALAASSKFGNFK